MMRMFSIAAACWACCVWLAPAYGFGPEGHKLVGAIADQRLAGTPTAAKVAQLLEGLTLARAAQLADDIKDWDDQPPGTAGAFHLNGSPRVEADLIAFHAANRQHREYHYTDVPVGAGARYERDSAGRFDHDVIHMIPICYDVLSGAQSENNSRKITKRVAVALLAHYVGDLHQPLHVGAQFFDLQGRLVNPDVQPGPAFHSKGGNQLSLGRIDNHEQPLHGFWDNDAFKAGQRRMQKALRTADPTVSGTISVERLAKFLAGRTPSDPGIAANDSIRSLAIRWADEILPKATEAHERLDYQGVRIVNNKFAEGKVAPREGLDKYRVFAGKLVENEVPKAGVRLAELLKRAMP